MFAEDAFGLAHGLEKEFELAEELFGEEAIVALDKIAEKMSWKQADMELFTDSFIVEIKSKPHRSSSVLPRGKMAVYAFFLNGQALKIGKAVVEARKWFQRVNEKSAAKLWSFRSTTRAYRECLHIDLIG